MKLTVALPTMTGREANVERFLRALAETAPVETEVLIRRDQSSCARVWNWAADMAEGEYTLLAADDLVPQLGWWEAATSCVDQGYIPVPLVIDPQGRVDSCGSRGNGQHYYWGSSLLPDGSFSSYMTVVPFYASEWRELLMPVGDVHYFSDDWFSMHARMADFALQVRHNYCFIHDAAAPGRQGTDRLDTDREIFAAAGGDWQ